MGLDMFLTADYEDGIDSEVAYWRKANAIHNWFVDAVQGGKDDCDRYPVTRDQLKALIRDCRSVLDDPANARLVLPTVSGFFFGSTDYDSRYFENLRDTVSMLEKALADANHGTQFFYHSSW
jgi:hypothetical protein